jgi:hypothetical protein
MSKTPKEQRFQKSFLKLANGFNQKQPLTNFISDLAPKKLQIFAKK